MAAQGAKFPASLPKTFSVTGETALSWAKLLGLPLDRGATLTYPLRPAEVNAHNLRNPEQSSDALSNQIIWDPSGPSLKLTGDWLDQMTGSIRKPPRFTFGAPFIPDDMSGGGPWVDLLRSFGFPREKTPPEALALLERRVSGDSLPKLTVTIYRAQGWLRNPKGEWGYLVDIGVDE